MAARKKKEEPSEDNIHLEVVLIGQLIVMKIDWQHPAITPSLLKTLGTAEYVEYGEKKQLRLDISSSPEMADGVVYLQGSDVYYATRSQLRGFDTEAEALSYFEAMQVLITKLKALKLDQVLSKEPPARAKPVTLAAFDASAVEADDYDG